MSVSELVYGLEELFEKLLQSPRGIWDVPHLNIDMACVSNLLNHFKLVKGVLGILGE